MSSNGVLRIESRCPSLVVGSCAADYRLTIPASVSVTVAAARGDVRLAGFSGSADVSTRGGSIVADAFCGFVLRATAKGGDVDVRTACSPERLELRTDTGDVTVTVPPSRYSVDADTNGGRVSVRGVVRRDDAPWRIQALSDSGDVTVRGGS